MLRDRDVFILCGGLGTRLRAEISDRPKVLAEIDGQPFLGILLDYLAGQGFTRFILGTGYKSEQIESFCRDKKSNLSVIFSREDEPLGTGGAIKYAKALINSDVFFALNGDCFCPIDFAQMLKSHVRHEACATLAVSDVSEKQDFGAILLGPADKILNFSEKSTDPSAKYVSAGIYCFNKDIFKFMPAKKNFSIETEFFPDMVGKDFYGFKAGHEFIDIGTPDRLKRAKDFLMKGR
ncbi:MAG TPA: sugar phosphate nucleotidyltransferase [Candidatus Omnitrophota bacterium]|nr:sugar phosphate nucleotidyltransferase [Candidatus Omnitrophota bacterium]HPD84137.1 sugar phosphate nucleotidyltransferase [Candidatus Omnitrophota bacterium]HRZ02994.1 sugar phosphate nucleotidyltransferase [Candidatus Omnitrophota bacterium]